MQRHIAIVLLVECTQAALLSKVHDSPKPADVAGEDLMIKMPEAVSEGTANTKPQASLSLVQAQTNTELGIFKNDLLHASVDIKKAKVKKLMRYIESAADEYEHGTADRKNEIEARATSLAMAAAGTRRGGGANLAMCQEVWSIKNELASAVSWFFCPTIEFTETIGTTTLTGTTREDKAIRTLEFWTMSVNSVTDTMQGMLDPDVAFYWGHQKSINGENEVKEVLPYIGWPYGMPFVLHPATWKCDDTGCVTPVKAWAGQMRNCYLGWSNDASPLLEKAIIPLEQWR